MKKNHFDELVKSIRQMKAIESGVAKPSRVHSYPDVKSLRSVLNVTQHVFSSNLGISDKTLKNWEQRRRVPTGPAKVLLNLLAQKPTIVWKLCSNTSDVKTTLVPAKKWAAKKTIKVRTKAKKGKMPSHA